MSREEIKEQERQVIKTCIKAHPTMLLSGPTSTAYKRLQEVILSEIATEDDHDLVKQENHPDLIFVDARVTKTAEAKRLRSEITAAPVRWEFRYLFLGYANRFHYVATQALLKMIEEPPVHLRVILATDRVQDLPFTIVSRATFYPISLPNQEELAQELEDEEVEEYAWRAQVAAGHPDIARELDTATTKEWFKLWKSCLLGNPPPELVFQWTERLQNSNEATKIGCWNLLVDVAIQAITDPFWQLVGQVAISQRERVRQNKDSKMRTANSLASAYAYIKTSAKRK